MATELLKKVRKTIKDHDMVRPGEKVVVAVSGGPDSVCLLDVLQELSSEFDISLVVAHFDHGLRPLEDDKETEFTRKLARKYGISFLTAKASGSIRGGKGSLEERARGKRYEFLEQVRRETASDKIALGHQLNDQAETLLLRLLRGSGTQGLASISPVRDNVFIRPLILVSRQEIVDYLTAKGLQWIEDSSNRKTEFLRNRIRLELLPFLERYQANIVSILARTAETMRLDNDILEKQADKWVQEHLDRMGEQCLSVPLRQFLRLHPSLQRRALRNMIKRVAGSLRRLSHAHIIRCLEIPSGSSPQAEVHLPGGFVFKKRYEHLLIDVKQETTDGDFAYSINGPGTHPLKAINSSIELTELGSVPLAFGNASQWEAFVDAEKISYPLRVRPFRSGDRIIPLGMKGRKKIHDLFVEHKVPHELRRRVPLVISAESVLWVPGIRVADNFKVTGRTQRVLRLCLYGEIIDKFEKARL